MYTFYVPEVSFVFSLYIGTCREQSYSLKIMAAMMFLR